MVGLGLAGIVGVVAGIMEIPNHPVPYHIPYIVAVVEFAGCIVVSLVYFIKRMWKSIKEKVGIKERIEGLLLKDGINGFTILELLLVVSISLIIAFGTFGFIKSTRNIKIAKQIGQEFESIYQASVKMARETTDFTIDDLVSKGYLKTKTSVIGKNYDISVNGSTIGIRLSLPSSWKGPKDFQYPVKYYSFLGVKWLYAE
ncbi:MAG TPA: hypothetical protein PKV21_09225, partial [bacterium]|nr:hypothetical protein [bacterium]